jgi:hypothetical protein
MKLTIDSTDDVSAVLGVLSAMYGVQLRVGEESETGAERPAARPAAATSRGGRGRGRRTAASRGSSADNTDIRAWARANGLPVSDRGRIPSSVVAAYRQAQG